MPRGGSPSVPSFDEGRVPVEVIELPSPATQGLSSEQLEVIGRKYAPTYRHLINALPLSQLGVTLGRRANRGGKLANLTLQAVEIVLRGVARKRGDTNRGDSVTL
jgi:hypothetical protein